MSRSLLSVLVLTLLMIPGGCPAPSTPCDGDMAAAMVDSDGDGTPDCDDGCPDDAAKTEPGSCGCGIPEGDSDGDAIPDCMDLTGTWRGDLACTRTESLGSTSGSPVTETVSFEITFNDAGVPTMVTILGFTGAPDQVAALDAVGESATQDSANGSLTVNQTATITATSFTSSRVEIGISIDYGATGGNLTQTGTATQTIIAEVSGDTLTYSSEADYSVQQSTGPIDLNTGETIRCEGTLSRV